MLEVSLGESIVCVPVIRQSAVAVDLYVARFHVSLQIETAALFTQPTAHVDKTVEKK